jgi:hypothetical protein
VFDSRRHAATLDLETLQLADAACSRWNRTVRCSRERLLHLGDRFILRGRARRRFVELRRIDARYYPPPPTPKTASQVRMTRRIILSVSNPGAPKVELLGALVAPSQLPRSVRAPSAVATPTTSALPSSRKKRAVLA